MTTIPDKNWNEEWKKNFNPIVVESKCLIKAPLHAIKEKYPIEIYRSKNGLRHRTSCDYLPDASGDDET